MLKFKLCWVQLGFPDGKLFINSGIDAESHSVLAILVAHHEQSVICDKLCLAKGQVGGIERRVARYGYGPYG